MSDLDLSEIQFGRVLAAFTFGYAIFQFPAGLIIDRFGARRTLAVIMMTWGVLTVATGVAGNIFAEQTSHTLFALIAVRFLVGVFHAPIYPLTGSVVERWFPIGSWALPNGLASAGLTIGTAVTAPLIVWMMSRYGWQSSFQLLAPLAFLGAALWWWYARDSPALHKQTNQEELDLIIANRAVALASRSEVPVWKRVLMNRNALLLMASYFCMNFVFYQMFNWVFYYLVTVREFAAQQASFLTSFQWLGAAVGAIFGGWLCDYLTRRMGIRMGTRIPVMIGLFGSALFLLCGAYTQQPLVAVGAIALCFLFNQMTDGAYWSAAISVGGKHSAAVCGVMNTGGNAVGVVNALLVPYLAHALGWATALASGALFAVVGGLLWLLIRADETMEG